MSTFVSTIFCDDVRHEVGGKMTYVGVYGTTMYVREFPLNLPQLFVVASVSVPITDSLRTAKLEIRQDNNLVAEVELPATPNAEDVKPSTPGEEVRGHTAGFIIAISPLVANAESRLTVTLTDEGREPIKAQGLVIKLADGSVEFPS